MKLKEFEVDLKTKDSVCNVYKIGEDEVLRPLVVALI